LLQPWISRARTVLKLLSSRFPPCGVTSSASTTNTLPELPDAPASGFRISPAILFRGSDLAPLGHEHLQADTLETTVAAVAPNFTPRLAKMGSQAANTLRQFPHRLAL
jgi:hypothetical protein